MKKVVIIGGGFAGTRVAKKLEKEFEVVLIDTKDYFEFTPGILRTIVEPKTLDKLQVKHVDYLKRAKVVVDYVDEVDKVEIKTKKGNKYEYDYLIVCSGSDYNLPIKEQEVFIGSRAVHLRKAHDKLFESKRVLVVGGGLVGVELAAEICTHCVGTKITLLHSRDRLIPRNNIKTTRYAEKFLKKKGVELLFEDKMKSVKNGICFTEKGKKIRVDMTFLTTGIKPNFGFMKKNFSSRLSKDKQIKVNRYLQISGEKNIFAAGDITSIKEEKTAQNAERQADIVVENVRALSRGREMHRYRVKKTVIVVSLGKYDGVIEFGDFVLPGILAAFLKWLVEKQTMMFYR